MEKIMRKLLLTLLIILSHSLFALTIGDQAPFIELMGHDGKTHKLSEFSGEPVILEWLNHGCPFVRKHYDSGNMQATQKKVKEAKYRWLSIISSAPGNQGYVDSRDARAEKAKYNSLADLILLDPSGDTGRNYEAKTTPYMVILDKDHKIIYMGAIDSIASADKNDITKADNYILNALSDLSQKKKIRVQKNKSYGCSVKY